MIVRRLTFDGGQTCKALVKCDYCKAKSVKIVKVLGYSVNTFCNRDCYAKYLLTRKNTKLKVLLKRKNP